MSPQAVPKEIMLMLPDYLIVTGVLRGTVEVFSVLKG